MLSKSTLLKTLFPSGKRLSCSWLSGPWFSVQLPAHRLTVLASDSKFEREAVAVLMSAEGLVLAMVLVATASASRLGEVVLLDLLLRVGGGGFSLGMNGCDLSRGDGRARLIG